MKRFTFLLAAAAGAPSALGCDFCAIYSAVDAHAGTGFFGGAFEQFTHFGTLQDEGTVVPNEVGQHLDSSISQVFAGYNFNRRFGVQLNLPAIVRSFKRPEGFAIDRGTEAGLGDVSLTGHFQAWQYLTQDSTAILSLLGGVKFPTGNSHRLREELNEVQVPGAPESGIHGHDLTLGSGSWDGIVAATFYSRCQRFVASASVQYSIRSEGAIGYRFANDLTWSGGPGVLLVLNEEFTLSLTANISGETKPRDTFQGAKAEDTGITTIYVGPEFNATWSDRLTAELGADIPVSIDNTALQAVPDYRLHAAFTWRF